MDKPPSSPRPWEADFEGALQRGDVLGAATVLREAGTRGHVSASLFRAAAVIVERLRPAPMIRRDWAQRLLAHPRRVDKQLAALIIMPLAQTDPRDVEHAAQRLAASDDWHVRMAAARLATEILPRSAIARELLASLAGDVRAPVRRAAKAAARDVEGNGD